MSSFHAARAAQSLLSARRCRIPIPAHEVEPPEVEDAFAVQAAVAASLGRTGGWKVGASGPGKPRTRAPIAASLIRPSPCRWPSETLIRLGIEVEIAFRIGRAIGADDLSAEHIRQSIAGIHAAIEIVDSRYDTWPVPDPLAALADNQNNGGLVYDPEVRPFSGQDLSRAQVTLTVSGQPVFHRVGHNPAGSPLDLLTWLARHLVEDGQGLQEGDLVTTGSLTGIDFVEPGSRIEAEVAGIGHVELHFTR